LKLPMSSIYMDPSIGTEFGLEVQMNDADGGMTARESLAKWWDSAGDLSWKNPSTFGTAVIVSYGMCKCGGNFSLSTHSATQVTGTSAVLNGSVDIQSDNPILLFQYGTTENYGQEIIIDQRQNLEWVTALVDRLKPNTLYHFRIGAADSIMTQFGGDQTFTTLEKGSADHDPIPNQFALNQNYPNPFNSGTVIDYSIPKPAFVSLSVYDVEGRCVTTLVQEDQAAGIHSVPWGGTDASGKPLGTGVYLCRLDIKGQEASYSAVKKMFLVR
jgi:hypothetical protein